MSKSGTLMVQGTTSNAGKSTVVTGICRVLTRRGYRVAPFKPQNMALNSAVTADGGEIGRAQAAQAQACRLDAMIDMNPILLKPTSEAGSQIIIHGKAIGNMSAVQYHQFKPEAKIAALASYYRLKEKFDYVVVEGAGSPAEINLREHDIANMGFAQSVDCDVILVADIDLGGVFAQIVGTMELLSEPEKNRIKGFIINKFRGDVSLLKSGLDWLEQRFQIPVLGVLPYISDLYLEGEDSQSIKTNTVTGSEQLNVVVPLLPRISNYTDFDALNYHPKINLTFARQIGESSNADLICLPGSKSVISDYKWLLEQGWDKVIQHHLRYGGKLLGICGGYQLLGKSIHDPDQIESDTTFLQTLGLLDFDTVLKPEKALKRVKGINLLDKQPFSGYEIHCGHSSGVALKQPFLELESKTDGVISNDNQIIGCYMHGLFDHPSTFQALVKWAGLTTDTVTDIAALREQGIDQIADEIEKNLSLDLVI